ncbi:hypothetical protein GQ53DRAFT_23922 [Thozetella sp. PMI_491]|nr:hypothetical protein GQ53DRAFT_23922 [Thozetella sp. PMI_491]
MMTKISALLGLASAVCAIPTLISSPVLGSPAVRSLQQRADCNNPPSGLTRDDCNYLASIGVSSMGVNSYSNNGQAWIGTNGGSYINVLNTNSVSIILVVWGPAGSWVNAIQPLVTYSLSPGTSVTVSLADSFSGAMSGVYDHKTTLYYGQVFNTWVEFTTQGQYTTGTIDISRLPNMNGNAMELWTPGAVCHAGMNECAFVCKTGDRCESPNDDLVNCQGPYKSYGFYNGAVQGGCQGWNYGLVNVHM